mgnify:CR=1 FL=1
MTKLTHLNDAGEAHMVDVGAKPATAREAVAEGLIRMQPETLALIVTGGHKKGDVLAVARVAGIMAAKKTAELIPLCHPIALTKVEVELMPDANAGAVRCRARPSPQSPRRHSAPAPSRQSPLPAPTRRRALWAWPSRRKPPPPGPP